MVIWVPLRTIAAEVAWYLAENASAKELTLKVGIVHLAFDAPEATSVNITVLKPKRCKNLHAWLFFLQILAIESFNLWFALYQLFSYRYGRFCLLTLARMAQDPKFLPCSGRVLSRELFMPARDGILQSVHLKFLRPSWNARKKLDIWNLIREFQPAKLKNATKGPFSLKFLTSLVPLPVNCCKLAHIALPKRVLQRYGPCIYLYLPYWDRRLKLGLQEYHAGCVLPCVQLVRVLGGHLLTHSCCSWVVLQS